ncbi:MAG: MFS transporter [Candidatus Rokubacteria bacterium]|nr:MFS transporter [Candidatus Rokubacteria bacterium]
MNPGPSRPHAHSRALNPLVGLFALSALTTLDSRAIMVTLPAIATTFGVTPGVAGYAVTAYAVSFGVLQLAYGPLSDRWGRVTVVRWAGLAFALATLLSGLAPSLGTFVVARLVTGVFAAAMVSTTFAHIGDTVPYARRHAVVGQFGATLATAQVAALSLGGVVAHVATWRLVFEAIGALGLAGFVTLAARRFDTPAAPPPPPSLPYLTILVMPDVWRVCGAVLVEGVFAFGGMTYFAVIAKRRYGVNDLEAGLLLGCFGAGAALAGLSLRRLAPSLGERRLARLGAFAHAAGWLAFGIGPTFDGTPAVIARGMPAVVFSILGAGWVWLHSTLQTRGTELSAEARGKAFALFAVSLFAGLALGAALLGRLVDGGHVAGATIACSAGVLAVGLWVGAQRVSG